MKICASAFALLIGVVSGPALAAQEYVNEYANEYECDAFSGNWVGECLETVSPQPNSYQIEIKADSKCSEIFFLRQDKLWFSASVGNAQRSSDSSEGVQTEKTTTASFFKNVARFEASYTKVVVSREIHTRLSAIFLSGNLEGERLNLRIQSADPSNQPIYTNTSFCSLTKQD